MQICSVDIFESATIANLLGRVANEPRHGLKGANMPQLRDHQPVRMRPNMPTLPRTEYVVRRREDVWFEDVWFIEYDGSEYCPYMSPREAMIFAVDAAHRLGQRGKVTPQVLLKDAHGRVMHTWTFGLDSYPPIF
jgi:hypothetical protein